jgi:hypothetical protein
MRIGSYFWMGLWLAVTYSVLVCLVGSWFRVPRPAMWAVCAVGGMALGRWSRKAEERE